MLFISVELYLFVCFETGSLFRLACLGANCVDQADLELSEIRLPLPPESGPV